MKKTAVGLSRNKLGQDGSGATTKKRHHCSFSFIAECNTSSPPHRSPLNIYLLKIFCKSYRAVELFSAQEALAADWALTGAPTVWSACRRG